MDDLDLWYGYKDGTEDENITNLSPGTIFLLHKIKKQSLAKIEQTWWWAFIWYILQGKNGFKVLKNIFETNQLLTSNNTGSLRSFESKYLEMFVILFIF